MSAPHEAPVRPSAVPEVDGARLRLVETDGVPRPPSAVRSPGASGAPWARAYSLRLLVSDAVVIAVAVIAGIVAATDLAQGLSALAGVPASVWTGAAVAGAAWLLLLGAYRTRDCRVLGSGPDEYKRLITACMSVFGLASMALLLTDPIVPGRVAVLTMALGLVGLLSSRWVWRRWLSRQRQLGNALSRALVVGPRAEIDYVTAQIAAHANAAFDVVGTLTAPEPGEAPSADRSRATAFGPEQIARTAATLGADTVIVAGNPGSGNDFIRHLAWQLEGTAAELVLAARLANVAGPRIHFRPIEGLPLIHVEIPQFEGGKHVVKRSLDIVVSSLALVVLSPLFLLLAVMIRLDSPGGAIFSQERVGRNLKPFRMYKFRSMVVDAPQRLAELVEQNEGSGVLFKLKNDPRITAVGRVIRKYSLDELPQIWNVLRGDMSLVGPRPPLPSEVQSYRGKINRRMYIKPGLTGMWQINGRSDLNAEDSTRLDLYYVENWSVVGDLVIMWRTVKVVLRPVGAY